MTTRTFGGKYICRRPLLEGGGPGYEFAVWRFVFQRVRTVVEKNASVRSCAINYDVSNEINEFSKLRMELEPLCKFLDPPQLKYCSVSR